MEGTRVPQGGRSVQDRVTRPDGRQWCGRAWACVRATRAPVASAHLHTLENACEIICAQKLLNA